MNHLLPGKPGPRVDGWQTMQYEMVPEPERSCDVMLNRVPALH